MTANCSKLRQLFHAARHTSGGRGTISSHYTRTPVRHTGNQLLVPAGLRTVLCMSLSVHLRTSVYLFTCNFVAHACIRYTVWFFCVYCRAQNCPGFRFITTLNLHRPCKQNISFMNIMWFETYLEMAPCISTLTHQGSSIAEDYAFSESSPLSCSTMFCTSTMNQTFPPYPSVTFRDCRLPVCRTF